MMFDIYGENYEITREHIVRAMEAFDRGDCPCIYKSFLTNPRFTRAVESDNGNLYPPRFLISNVTGLPGPEFHANLAVQILSQLGFRVVDKPNPGAGTSPNQPITTDTGEDEPIEIDTGNDEKKVTPRWTLDRVKKLLDIPVTVLAIITGALTAISLILALIRSM